MKRQLKKTAVYSLFIILAAQLSMNLFIADFKISIAIIFLPVFLFLTEDFPLIPVTFCSTAGVFASRAVMFWLRTGSLGGSLPAVLPETAFYMGYGFLLYLYTFFLRDRKISGPCMALPFVLIDYAANFMELYLRLQAASLNIKNQAGILLVAALRSLVILAVLAVFDRYKLFLLKKEHEERYRKLLFLISRLNGEMIWMQKNTALIEDTMQTAYRLSEDMKKAGADPKFVNAALSVAKDIHEVKKEYFVILRGISEALDQELKSDGMYLEEMFSLLKDFAVRSAGENKKELSIQIRCEDHIFTDKQYILMSVFRNLLQNAIEAAKEPEAEILLSERSDKDTLIFEVTDHGPGIIDEYREEIFTAGFSTKINYSTGEINRGLGLNLVRDLVENKLDGHIHVESEPGKTTFTFTAPRKTIERVSE